MSGKRALALIGACGWLSQPAVGATLSITPGTATVAQGGNLTFTVTVVPSTYVQRVEFTYQGESGVDTDTSAPYEATHTFNTPGDDLVVTATVIYSNGDPSQQATATVDAVGLTISGPASPLRAWTTSYTLASNPAGRTLSQINWTYSWAGGSNSHQDSTIWYGKMLVAGTLSVSATVSGVTAQASRSIVITPRSWTVAITCAQDNDPDYGDLPTAGAELGQNRDLDSNYGSYVFGPRSGPTSFTTARTLSQATSGPCTGLWYVASSTLKCQRETVINRYIKSDGPALGGMNFQAANANCFSTSAADFLQAVMNHEYRGTPDTAQSLEGHQGVIEKTIIDEDADPKKNIEALTGSTQTALSIQVDDVINTDEATVLFYATSEGYMMEGPNWGGEDGLGTGQNARWDPDTSQWTDCVNGPFVF